MSDGRAALANAADIGTLAVHPLWWDDNPPVGSYAPLAGSTDADVAIVGGGCTGLWTAYYLARRDPTLRIIVLEAEAIGFGASGRNGGWLSAQIPMSLATMSAVCGADAATRMQRAMHDTVGEVVDRCAGEQIDARIAVGGTVVAARSQIQAQRLHAEIDEFHSFGFGDDDLRWLDQAEAARQLGADGIVGASYTPHCAAVHPARLVHGLARTVAGRGVRIVEHTPVTSITSGVVRTAGGAVRAPVVVRATEAFTCRLPGLRRAIAPVYSLMVATEPLDPSALQAIGLAGRATFADGRRTIIYGQRTADDRLAFGGRGAPYHFASSMSADHDGHQRIHRALANTLIEMFPMLAGIRFTHRWGGAVGIPRDWWCSVGFDRATGQAWAGGYVGDGLSTTNLAGRTLCDLIVGDDSELTSLPWVGHRSPAWEPEPLRWAGINGAVLLPRSIDRSESRGRPARLRSAILGRLTGH